MPPYQYGHQPGWGQQPNPPYWAPPPNNPYAHPHQPVIPPRPAGYGGATPYQWPGAAPQPNWNPDAYRNQHRVPLRPPSQPQPLEPVADPTEIRSKKWPQLNAILAVDTTNARFKVTNKPSQEILASTFYTFRHIPANATPTQHMRLFSKKFPWSVEIPSQQDITCEVVWNAIWALLQQPLGDSEWGMLCARGADGEKKIKEILKANKKRIELNGYGDKRILRCDYLGEDVWFLGLEKDEEYQKMRLLPGSAQAERPLPQDSWLVSMGR